MKITRIEIRDIVPPADLVNAMGGQMKAEREKRAVVLEAEGQRQSEILRAEGQKQAPSWRRKGRLEAAGATPKPASGWRKPRPRPPACCRNRSMTARRRRLNYYIAEKYVKAFESLAKAPNQKVVLLPYEATALLSTLSGIGELARDAFGWRRPGGTHRPTGPATGGGAKASASASTATGGPFGSARPRTRSAAGASFSPDWACPAPVQRAPPVARPRGDA